VIKHLALADGLLILSFGVPAFVAPVAIFAPISVQLDPAAAVIARGYAATLIGYGWALFGLRSSRDAGVIRTLLVSMLLFNALEIALQSAALLAGYLGQMAIATITAHAALTIWSITLLLKQNAPKQ
jgi:hypothetical protein